MRGRYASGRVYGDGAQAVDEQVYPHPFELTYAASAGAVDEQTGESDGAWIIWLPDGCLVVDGVEVDPSSGLTAANNYPSGWYDLTGVLSSLSSGATSFSLYLDVDSAEFKLSESACSSPVLIASVSDLSSEKKDVLQVVRSSIVIGGALYPWKIKIFEVTSGSITTKHIGVWVPKTSAIVIAKIRAASGSSWLAGAEKLEAGGAISGLTVLAYGTGGVWADAGAPMPDSNTGKISTGVWGSWTASLGSISCQLHTGSYTVGGNLSTFFIGNVISDVCVNCISSRIFMQVSRLGSDKTDAEDDLASLGGDDGGMFPWDTDTRTIGGGGCMVGRRWYTASGTGSGKVDGLYQLKVTLTLSGATCEVVSGVPLGTAPSGNISYIPIYQISNAKISVDYRGAFVVPCWE